MFLIFCKDQEMLSDIMIIYLAVISHVDGHLEYFQSFTIKNSIAVNI
jgi:hypothetical protein